MGGDTEGPTGCMGLTELLTFMVVLLQWNARSLLANGQEFNHFVRELDCKPDIICIQETWLKPNLDYVLYGYTGVRRDREHGGRGGRCLTLIRLGVPFRVLELGVDLEYTVVEIWDKGVEMVVINYNNPCKRLELERLFEVKGQDRSRVVWCADFNAHSTL